MFRSTLLAVSALAAVASAQNSTLSTGNTTYFYGTDGSLQIDPTLITDQIRSDWCLGQTNNCPEVCDEQTSANECDPATLEWTCTCSDSSLQPNITNYAAMMPSYICDTWIELCVYDHPDDSIGQRDCRSITCGSENATEAASGGSTTSSAPSSSSTTPSTTSGSGSGSETTPTSSETPTDTGAAAALNVAQAYGSSILAAGLLGIFGLAL